MSGSQKISQGQYLFREGDPPDAMYVLKSGKLAVVKTKQNSEIVLAEMGPGAMVGEMAFFDNKPRSASVKALKDAEVIALPYKALHAQFTQFPEWTKAIMRTVNNHLRTANARIKTLEKGEDGDELFPPHTLTKLLSILSFVGNRYGKTEPEGLVVHGGLLRDYTIQIFQEATSKMQRLTSELMALGYAKVEELGEGNQTITIVKPDFLFQFVDWYNTWLFKKEESRITVKEDQLPVLAAVLHFAKKGKANDKGLVAVNLTEMQSQAQAELNRPFKMEDVAALIKIGLMTEKTTQNDGSLQSLVQLEEVEKLVPFWQLIYAFKKIIREPA
jgi:CRP/FNR family cyclic AMP-dependent transcriptional regulator